VADAAATVAYAMGGSTDVRGIKVWQKMGVSIPEDL